MTSDANPKSGEYQAASEKSPRGVPVASTTTNKIHGGESGIRGDDITGGHSPRRGRGSQTARSSHQGGHWEDASRRSLTHVDLLLRQGTPRTNQPDLLARVYLCPPASLPRVRDHPACLLGRQRSYLRAAPAPARGVRRDPDASWEESRSHGDGLLGAELAGDTGRGKRSRKRSKFEVMTSIYMNPQPRQSISSLSARGEHPQAH